MTKFPDLTRHLERVDLAMLAAAVVEVPRWAVAFMAIREPAWAAVPMGLLLAWAASAGWKAYFEQRRRYLLLCINVASLLGALVVIAPVLYAMTFQPLDAIDLSVVLPRNLLWAWAATLAITTFVPLVQVAAVKAYRVQHDAPAPAQPVNPPSPAVNHDAHDLTPAPAPSTADVTPVNQEPHAVAHLVSLTNAEIHRLTGVSRQTVSKWRADGTLAVKLADKLPAQVTPHVNGKESV